MESVIECGDASTAREMIAKQRPDIVFLDIEMPEATGLDIAPFFKYSSPINDID